MVDDDVSGFCDCDGGIGARTGEAFGSVADIDGIVVVVVVVEVVDDGIMLL